MQVLAALTSLTCLGALMVVLRLGVRLSLRSVGLDDILIVMALVTNFGLFGCRVFEIHHGLGTPREELSDSVFQSQIHALWLSLPFYHFTLITSKLSALALYKRIFRVRRALLMVYCLSTILVICGMWMVLSAIFFCIPIHDFWTASPLTTDRKCLPEGPVWLFNGSIQIATNILILAIPLVMIPRLKLRSRQKVGLLLLFGMGLIVVAISIAQLITVIDILRNHDLTHKSLVSTFLSSIEASTSIICACMPPLYPAFSRICSWLIPLLDSSGSTQRSPMTISINLTHDIAENSIFMANLNSYTASVQVLDNRRRREDHSITLEDTSHMSILRTVSIDIGDKDSIKT